VKIPHPSGILLQHPIGATDREEERWMRQTLRAALDVLGGHFLVLGPNTDPGSDGTRRALLRICNKTQAHLPRSEFLRFLAASDVIVGNSSAGLIEAAALRIPCVNIGPRQNGREKPANVIDCGYGQRNVAAAIRKAMKLDPRRMKHPYGDGHAGKRIALVLATVDFTGVPVRKRNDY
jgi:hypothetical protein